MPVIPGQEAGGSSDESILNTFFFKDDFVSSEGPLSRVTTGTPTLSWDNVPDGGRGNRPGVVRHSGNLGDGIQFKTEFGFILGKTAVGSGGAQVDIGFSFKISAFDLDGAADRIQRVCIGLHDAGANARPSNGVYLEYEKALFGDDFWRLTCSKADTHTRINVGSSSLNWTEVKIAITPNSDSVSFFIDGVSQGAITTNIPDATLLPLHAQHYTDTSAALNAVMALDYMWIRQVFEHARRHPK